MNVLFLAYASREIGAGHLMRSLALAQGVAAKGFETTLITSSESPASLIAQWESLGSRLVVEKPLESSMDSAKRCLSWAEESRAEWIVLDGYGFDSAFQNTLKQAGFRLLVIDDSAHLPWYHTDILLNHNWNAAHLSYGCDSGTMMLLGTRYTLLRQEFLQWRGWVREIPDEARHILVTLGGGEHASVTRFIVDALKELDTQGPWIKVIGTDSSPGRDVARDRDSSFHGHLEVLGLVDRMAEVMAWADMAISGGGTTCWEMAYMGLPNLIFVLADNQEGVAAALDGLGCSVKLGSKETLSPQLMLDLIRSIGKDRKRREVMAEKGRALVDGLGVTRVVESMVLLGERRE